MTHEHIDEEIVGSSTIIKKEQLLANSLLQSSDFISKYFHTDMHCSQNKL